LTALGHRQARLVAARLKSELQGAAIRLVTSDLLCTQETAAHIVEALGVAATVDARVREHNNGDAVNLTMEQAGQRFPGVFGRPWELDFRPFPNSETSREFYERVGGFVDEAGTTSGPPLIVVTHGGTIANIVGRWLRLSAEAFSQAGCDAHPTGLTVLTEGPWGQRRIERLNDVAHLQGIEGWARLPV